MHFTFDQWIKLGSAAGGLGGFFAFLTFIYRKLLRPLCMKIIGMVDEERKFRAEIRQTILSVNEFKTFFESIKTEIVDLVDLIQWASAMRTYADVRIVPQGDGVKAKAAAATGETVEVKENGGLKN